MTKLTKHLGGSSIRRRDFLATTAAGPFLVSSSALGTNARAAASDRITVGVIGLGSRGFNLLNEFLAERDAQVVALCDVHDLHYRDRPWGRGAAMGLEPAAELTKQKQADSARLFLTSDFREICARAETDVVVVATPDHWHARCTLEAVRAGKDVYCEKPLTHTFLEGQAVYREVAHRKAVFQTGSQQRSDAGFRRAVELARAGHLGRIERVEVGLPPGYPRPQGDTTVESPPKGLDYDFWCGPSEKLPYMRARHHRWWRGHRVYGGGVLMDWIGHHNDIAHWALGEDRGGPQTVEARDWVYPETDVYNTPQRYEIHCEYAGGVVSSISSLHRQGLRLVGSEGWVFVTRGQAQASRPEWLEPEFDPKAEGIYRSPGHVRNFLDCVKSRKPCVAPAETAHRSITPGHLGYVSDQLGRKLRWDAIQERMVDDPAAEKLLRELQYRAPWTLQA